MIMIAPVVVTRLLLLGVQGSLRVRQLCSLSPKPPATAAVSVFGPMPRHLLRHDIRQGVGVHNVLEVC